MPDWLVSALIGVLAATFVAWYAAKEQRRQWRDDRRLDAYVALLDGIRLVMFRGGDISPGASTQQQKESLREAMRTYRTAYERIRLVGPPEMADVNEHLHDYVTNKLSLWFEDPSRSDADDAPEVLEARQMIEAFRTRAEKVVGMTDALALSKEVKDLRKRRAR